MPDTTFNGYSNFNTWNVALYLDNDYTYYLEMQDRLKQARYRHDAKALGKSIAVYVKSIAARNGSFGDLRPYRLRGVNWREIAEGYIQELDLEAYYQSRNERDYWPEYDHNEYSRE